LLTLDFGDAHLPARIVGTVERFPTLTADEELVVADESRLATALDADAPGTAAPGELWLSVPESAAREADTVLAGRPFSALSRMSRLDLVRQREHDPLSRAIVYTLGMSALLALVLSVLGLWVTLVGEAHDERGEYFDLEAQGIPPETLRWHLRLRALSILVAGIAGGVLLGLVLSRLVISLVQVSAGTASPEPPLAWKPGWPMVGVLLAALILTALVVTEATVRQTFRGDTPERGSWSLE
jgi:hypothetical protein